MDIMSIGIERDPGDGEVFGHAVLRFSVGELRRLADVVKERICAGVPSVEDASALCDIWTVLNRAEANVNVAVHDAEREK